jgi:hypothetical protein
MKTVTASLEGMRIVVDDTKCALEQYDFVIDRWFPKDAAEWPLSLGTAEQWLAGWNSVDMFAAINVLTAPKDHEVDQQDSMRRLHPLRGHNGLQGPSTPR